MKPPADYMNSLSQEEQDKFIHDLYDSFRTVSRDFMAEDAIKGAVYQKDEQGAHLHIAGSSKLPDGTICTDKIICPSLWNALNAKIPAEMRQKGWKNVEACQNYDPEYAKTLESDDKAAYIEECKSKRPKLRGVSSERYKAEKEIERLREEVERLKEAQTPAKAPETSIEAPRIAAKEKPKADPPKPVEPPQKPPERPQTREEIQAEMKARMARIIERARMEIEEEQPAPKQAPAAPPAPTVPAPAPRPSAPPEPTSAPRPLPQNAPQLSPVVKAPERNNNFSL